MATHDRDYFAMGKGRSAVDPVWRNALKAETAVARRQGRHAACLMWDLSKYYEHFEFNVMVRRALRLQVPRCLNATYGWVRGSAEAARRDGGYQPGT